MLVNTFSSVYGEEPTSTDSEALVVPLYEFKSFNKIPRLSRDCVVTEKIDGTNAHVFISDDLKTVLAGSRNRWVTPGKTTDNYGFAAWVEANREELLKLGPGRHYGEWWGEGINRGYGESEKHFSLFQPKWIDGGPLCVNEVPILYSGEFNTQVINGLLDTLKITGSHVAPGFMQPEGIVIFHTASKQYYKKTVESDEKAKGHPSV